jgi:hypothetical protein
MCVSILPFPASLPGEYGEQQLGVAIYAASMVMVRLLLTRGVMVRHERTSPSGQ